MKALKCLGRCRSSVVLTTLVLLGALTTTIKADESVFSVGVLCSKSDVAITPELTVFFDVNYGALGYLLTEQSSVDFTVKTRVLDITRNDVILDTTLSLSLPSSPPPRDLRSIQLQVDTGFYRIECAFTDARNNIQDMENRNVYSIDFSSMNTSLSSTILGTDVTLGQHDTIFAPYFNTNVSTILDNSIFAFAELYAPPGTTRITQAMLFAGDSIVAVGSRDTLSIQSATTRLFTNVPIVENPTKDVYSLKLLVFDESDSVLVYSQRLMDFSKTLALESFTDEQIDAMIMQLRYIAEPEDTEHMEMLSEPEARRNALARYWSNKDPFPATSKNEAFVEYYTRVAYASANYGSYTSGWLTDRGMIHIIYGHPQSKRNEYSTFRNTQAEIWTYNHATYEFVDRTGFGDYVLLGPKPTAKFKYR